MRFKIRVSCFAPENGISQLLSDALLLKRTPVAGDKVKAGDFPFGDPEAAVGTDGVCTVKAGDLPSFGLSRSSLNWLRKNFFLFMSMLPFRQGKTADKTKHNLVFLFKGAPISLQRRRFGKTEMNLSVLSFGAMRIVPEKDETETQSRERAFATLRRALDVGINHIETARGYGQSEQIIGSALKEGRIRRDEFYLTTKIGPNASGEEFRRALDDSMARMNVSYVDNLDIHGINTPELLQLSLGKGACMDAARQAVAEGRVGHLGFSTHGPLQTLLDAIDTDLFASINLHYYYINPRNLPAVQRAAQKDMGVFIISPTDKGGQLFRPPQKLTQLCEPWTPIQMNQRWLLAQPEVHTLSLGCERPEEFDAHLEMANRTHGPLTPEEAAIFARLDAAMGTLGDSYCNFCHACLPCPEEVHIPEILRLRNLTQAFDMQEFGKYRYKMFVHQDAQTGERVGGAGHWFPGADAAFCTDCGDCLPRCPRNLPIPTLLRETHALLSGDVGKRLWEEE